MKFLVDAHLPMALSIWLKQKGFDSIHTRELEAGNRTKDIVLFNFSMESDRIVITKDNDFLQRYLIKAEPKKLLFLPTGNLSNKKLINLFDNNFDTIISLLENNSVIELSLDTISILF